MIFLDHYKWGDLAIAAGGTGMYGASGDAAKRLKSTSGWSSSGNGTDAYGFSALPGGYRYSNGGFDDASISGYWWTATESGSSSAYYRYMYYDYGRADESNSDKGHGYSVRCISDN